MGLKGFVFLATSRRFNVNMEVEKPKEEKPKEVSAPTQPTSSASCQSKRPSQALYVPKQGRQAAKDKANTQGEDKPRPKPRYTDKARKNARNKKDKANTAAHDEAGDAQSGDVKEERLQESEVVNGKEDVEASSQQEAASPQVETEEEEEESWETLFNDDGDCLDPHLMEEVRTFCGF